MKIKSLFLIVFISVLSHFTYGRTYFQAFSSEVSIELSSDKTEYALYEPVVLHLKVTYMGNYASKEINSDLERVVFGCYPVWASGPFKPIPHAEVLPTHMIAPMPITERGSVVLLPGESLERDFWIYPDLGRSITVSPGDYEIWIAPEGEWVQPNRRFESEHLKIKVAEPQGKDKEAFDYAKTPQRLLALMGGPVGGIRPVTKEEIKAQPRDRAFNMKDDGIPFLQRFIAIAEGSAYHPFALFTLSRAYFLGWAETRKKKTKAPNVYSREPDYELLLQSADEFIKLYPDHPLANEMHLFRLVALYGLGKKDDAAKEHDLIHERLAPLSEMLWEQFRRNKGPEWEEENAGKKMEEGPLYVWGVAKKVKDLFENGMINGQKRRISPKLSEKEWPVQTRELYDSSSNYPIFKSRWAPR